ncbi:MAG: S8 family serine peptidase [Cyanobacteria bacterium P01_A01_bin.45]
MHLNNIDDVSTTQLDQNTSYTVQALTDNNIYTSFIESQSNSYISLQDISATTDILWQNYANGEQALWYMDNSVLTDAIYLGQEENTAWFIEETGDFNRDGEADILWRNYATGENYLEYMNDSISNGGIYLNSLEDTNWYMEGTGDFDHDGNVDILWRNYESGENALWYMNNSTLIGGTYINSLEDTNWSIEGTGDFNHDGHVDILWRNYDSGENALWYMNNSTLIGGTYINSLEDTNWNIGGTGDFNHDGHVDILWRNYDSGENALWYMNNNTLTGGTYLEDVTNTNWVIAGVLESYIEPNDSLNTAYDFGFLSGSLGITDFVGDTDNNDYFRFTLNNISDFRLTLSNLTADADVELLNSSGDVIEYSDNWFSDNETITLQLNADTYYIQVYSFYGNTSYNLDLSATPTIAEPNNSIYSAYNLGVLNSSISIADSIGAADTDDYFRFTLNNSSDFRLVLSDLTADADVELLNSSGDLIGYSINVFDDDETINQRLDPGTYYIQIYPYSEGIINYNLVLSITAPSDNFSSDYGYGLVNASEAVARGIGESVFADVGNWEDFSWDNDMVGSPEVWARGYSGEGVTVAVIDSGVDIYHQNLSNNIWRNGGEIEGNGIDDDGNGYIDDIYGWNFIENNNNVLDGNGHGTHVSGTIAGGYNDLGVVGGVAYNALIMPVRVLDNLGYSSSNSVTSGIYYAVNNGADVINLSLGSDYANPEQKAAIEYANNRGVMVVMAAGNDSASAPKYPANYATEYGISVGALNSYGVISEFSNRAGDNRNISHLMAPGSDIYSTIPGGSYESKNGTSMAAPHVAGIVALMLDANPNLTPAQIREILISTAIRLA